MNFLRKTAVAAAASLLVVTLFSFGLAWSVHQVFGTSKDIKHALSSSGLYQSVVSEVLSHQQADQSQGGNTVPVNQPQVKQIIESAFPPQFLQSQTEQVINSMYAWVDGKTPSLQFSVNLGAAKVQLADALQQYAQQHLATLPTCSAAQIPSGDVDPFNATCLPPGVDVNAVAAKARDQILNGDFLKDSTISADSIKASNGKTLAQQLHGAPTAYRRAKLGMLGGGVLALLLAAAVVFASATWRNGLRKVSVILITVGAISASLGWLSSFAVRQGAQKVASVQTGDKALQQQMVRIVESLADNLRTWWMAYGIALAVIGVVALLAVHFSMPREVKPLAAEQPKPDTEPGADPHTSEPKPAEAPKPPKPRRQISS